MDAGWSEGSGDSDDAGAGTPAKQQNFEKLSIGRLLFLYGRRVHAKSQRNKRGRTIRLRFGIVVREKRGKRAFVMDVAAV